MTQETMTKEQILEKMPIDNENEFLYTRNEVLKAMSEWEQQQLSAERERSWKLVEALTVLEIDYRNQGLHLSAASIKRIVNQYKQTNPNQDHTNPSS